MLNRKARIKKRQFLKKTSYFKHTRYTKKKDGITNWIVDDLDLAYSTAKKVNKPIFIDFTGYACTNCQWMERNIFTIEEVKNLLNTNFVLLKLYTDGKHA